MDRLKKYKMTKIITSVALLIMSVATLKAQDEKPFPGKVKDHRVMTPKLNFSEEQRQKMEFLHQEFKKQMMDLKKNEDITVKEYRNRMEALRKAHQEQVRSLFTNEQKSQIEKARLERKAKHEERMKEEMTKMKTRLDLNDDQARKISENRKAMAEKLKSIHENEAITREQKKEQFKSLKEKQKSEMKSILTEEQLEKMKEMKKHHEKKHSHRQRV